MTFSFVKRLFSLLDFCALEGLTVQGLRYLVLDWNYRDQKLRRMVDIPEVARTDMFVTTFQRYFLKNYNIDKDEIYIQY